MKPINHQELARNMHMGRGYLQIIIFYTLIGISHATQIIYISYPNLKLFAIHCIFAAFPCRKG